MTKKVVSLNLSEKTIEILENFKKQTNKTKSEIVRDVFTYLGKNPMELKKILVAELGFDRAEGDEE